MATKKEALFSPVVSRNPQPRYFPDADGVRPKKFATASGSPLLAQLSPVSQRSSDDQWVVWSAAENATYTLTSNATPATAGDFTLDFFGEVTAAIAFDATAAVVQAAIEALGQVNIGDVTCVDSGGGVDLGDASHIVTITFGGSLVGLDANGAYVDNTTGNAHVLAETVAGGGLSTSEIAGFVERSEGAQLDATDQTLHPVMTLGIVHRDDVPLPAGESQGALDAVLKSMELRRRGIKVQGLEGTP